MKPAPETPSKKKVDFNPNSKPNKEFRERHDLSLQDFKRFAQNYRTQYG